MGVATALDSLRSRMTSSVTRILSTAVGAPTSALTCAALVSCRGRDVHAVTSSSRRTTSTALSRGPAAESSPGSVDWACAPMSAAMSERTNASRPASSPADGVVPRSTSVPGGGSHNAVPP